MVNQSTGQANRLLGYPDDARLLLVNADDFGMYHAINEAVMIAFRDGIVRSTSLMVPYPLALHAMRRLRENPDISFGVHLTLVCDIDNYRWHPLVSKDKVPSLVDETGCFYTEKRAPDLFAQVALDEVELEFHAQIETVLDAGLKPAHLDWHCLHNGGRADIFDLTLGLAKEYDLALRVAGEPFAGQLQAQGLPTNDHELLDSFRLDLDDKSSTYAQMLRELPPGLTEWAVHPGLGDAESQAIDPGGWQVRRTDFDFVTSPEARAIIEQEGIILIDYRALQAVWQAAVG